MTVTFIDSSAIVKLIIREEETRALKRWLAHRDLISSSIARTEVPRAVWRTGVKANEPSVRDVLDRIQLLAADEACLDEAAALAPASLGSLDAIHLASALMLGVDVDAFVTYDRSLARAARVAGLMVEAPT